MKFNLLFTFLLLIFSISCQKNTEPFTDATPPSVPQGLTFSNVTTASAELSWSASTDEVGVEGYQVYRDGTEVAEVTDTNYAATGLSPSTAYSYEVSAFDAAGNESSLSEAVEFTTESSADVTPPSVPQGLEFSNVTTTSVELSWSASTDEVGVEGYRVYQNGTEIAEVTATSYTAMGLSPSTAYNYEVSAFDAAGNESNQSETINVTTESEQTVTKVLVFTKTSGYDHNTRSEASGMVEQIGSELGFEVTVDDTGNEFNSLSNLSSYSIIFFTNTSGNTLNDSQRSNVEAYAAQGGSFISNHAASDSYGHSSASTVSGNGKGVWDWYSENVTGCSVRNNPNHTSSGFGATVTIENQNNALTMDISFPWNDNEEWYYWEGGYLNSSFTELLRVSDTGSESYDDPRMTAQYLTRSDGGKSFYSSMGHSKSKYADPEFVQLMTNAFAFLLAP